MPIRKYTDTQIRYVWQLIRFGWTDAEIAARVGMPHSTIASIRRYRTHFRITMQLDRELELHGADAVLGPWEEPPTRIQARTQRRRQKQRRQLIPTWATADEPDQPETDKHAAAAAYVPDAGTFQISVTVTPDGHLAVDLLHGNDFNPRGKAGETTLFLVEPDARGEWCIFLADKLRHHLYVRARSLGLTDSQANELTFQLIALPVSALTTWCDRAKPKPHPPKPPPITHV